MARRRAVFYVAGAVAMLLALSCAIGVGYRGYRIVEGVIAEANRQLDEATPRPLRAVIAVRELPAGTAIRKRDVRVYPFNPGVYPMDRTFTTLEEVVGRTPTERILPQEVIRVERLDESPPSSGQGTEPE